MVAPSETSATTPEGGVPPPSPVAPGDAPPGLIALAHSLWQQVCGLAHDQLELLSLEAQMAGQSLAHLLMLGAAVGVLLSGTWLCGLLVGGLWLWELGLRPTSIALIAMLLNATALTALIMGMRRARHAMGFTRSLEALRPLSQPQIAPLTPP